MDVDYDITTDAILKPRKKNKEIRKKINKIK